VIQVIAKHKFPINIATKSKLITRDIDILNEIANDTWCTVGFSVTTTDEVLAKFLEPYSSPPSERLKALKNIKKKAPKIQVGTYFIPIIPFLEDNDENLEDVIKQSKRAGADFLLFSPGLTLRDSQAEYFIKKLNNSKYNYVIKLLLELYKGQIYPPTEYVRKLHTKLFSLCEKYDIAIRIKRWIPDDFRKINYLISEILLNKEYIDAIKYGKSNNAFKWAGLNLNNLEESILNFYRRQELSKLKNFNTKVIEYVEHFLKEHIELIGKSGLDKFL